MIGMLTSRYSMLATFSSIHVALIAFRGAHGLDVSGGFRGGLGVGGGGGMREPLIATKLTKLTPDEIAAIPKKYRPN